MTVKEAVISFSQVEKIKSGIIWASHTVEMLRGLPPQDWQGAERIIKTIVDMIANEVHLAKKLLKDDSWGDVVKKMDTAIVMNAIHNFLEDRGAFWIITCTATGQYQTGMNSRTEQVKSFNDPGRIFEPIKPRDLGQNG